MHYCVFNSLSSSWCLQLCFPSSQTQTPQTQTHVSKFYFCFTSLFYKWDCFSKVFLADGSDNFHFPYATFTYDFWLPSVFFLIFYLIIDVYWFLANFCFMARILMLLIKLFPKYSCQNRNKGIFQIEIFFLVVYYLMWTLQILSLQSVNIIHKNYSQWKMSHFYFSLVRSFLQIFLFVCFIL